MLGLKKASLRLLTCALSVLTLLPSARAARPDVWNGFREFYRTSLRQYGVVGSSVEVIEGGQTIFRDVYGQANREKRQAVDESTTFHWASITKTFTGIAIMQLRDHGKLQLDDPVVRYVPELRMVHDPYGPIAAITIRELMSHTAGFRSATWPWSKGSEWEPFEPTKWSQIAAMLPYTEVMFAPGTRHSYSNLGVVFLGQIIERLSGDDYEVYIDKNILKPLRMHGSYFDQAPYFLLKDRAEGYERENGILQPAPFNFDSGITVSNSGLNSPFPDMIRYLDFLMGVRDAEHVYSEVLKRSSLEEMFQKQMAIADTDSSQTVSGNKMDWVGLSFFLHEMNGHLYVGHGGQQGGFISHFYVEPERKTGYLIAFNTDSSDRNTNVQKLDRELRDAILPRLAKTTE